MNTSSSPKRSRSNSPSALPDVFPFYEALKGHVGIFRHIFFDMMDAETRHICRAVSSSWMNGLPALEGPDVTAQLNNWVFRTGYAQFLAVEPLYEEGALYHRVYRAVERGHYNLVTILASIDEDVFRERDSTLKIVAVHNCDLEMLKFLYQVTPRISSILDYQIGARCYDSRITNWLKEIKAEPSYGFAGICTPDYL